MGILCIPGFDVKGQGIALPGSNPCMGPVGARLGRGVPETGKGAGGFASWEPGAQLYCPLPESPGECLPRRHCHLSGAPGIELEVGGEGLPR